MKLKVNFKADKPTLNGHVYPKETLKKAFDERFDKGNVFITSHGNSAEVDLSKIVGKAKSYEINKDSEILVDTTLIGPMREDLKKGVFEISTFGVGSINDKKVIGADYKLSHFFLALDDRQKIEVNEDGVKKPNPPLSRQIREGDTGPFCPKCKSSLKRKYRIFIRSEYCIQPRCENYYGRKKK